MVMRGKEGKDDGFVTDCGMVAVDWVVLGDSVFCRGRRVVGRGDRDGGGGGHGGDSSAVGGGGGVCGGDGVDVDVDGGCGGGDLRDLQ